jgi:hypothetical protein
MQTALSPNDDLEEPQHSPVFAVCCATLQHYTLQAILAILYYTILYYILLYTQLLFVTATLPHCCYTATVLHYILSQQSDRSTQFNQFLSL